MKGGEGARKRERIKKSPENALGGEVQSGLPGKRFKKLIFL